MEQDENYRQIQAKHGSRGGKTTFKKVGRKGMSKLGKLSAKKRKVEKIKTKNKSRVWKQKSKAVA